MPVDATLLIRIAALAVLCVAAAIDIRERLLPNPTVLLVMAGGVVLRLLSDPGWPWPSLAIWFAAVLVLGFIMAGRNWIGWGDAKMIAAVTLLVPPAGVADLLLAICIAGGVLSCLYIATRHVLLRGQAAGASDIVPPGLAGIWQMECDRIRRGGPMPYGVAILGGTAYSVLLR